VECVQEVREAEHKNYGGAGSDQDWREDAQLDFSWF
jgi:hypothetical protein